MANASTKRLIALFLACSSVASLAQSQWTPFSDAKGRFSVLLPGKPTQTAETPPTFNVSTPSAIYVISYTDGHEGADWAQTVNSERDVTIQGLNGKLIREKEISLGDFRGKSVTFDGSLPSGPFSGPATGQMRIYFNGHRFYMLIGLAPKAAKPEGITKFLDSFQILPASKSP